MTIKAKIRDEIRSELDELNGMEVGSDKYRATIDGVTKLADRMIELEKIDIDAQDRAENREIDYELKLKQINDEKKDRVIKNCLTGASLVTGVGLAIWGTVVSMKFEKEDSFTSLLGRKWVNSTISFLKK